MTRVMHFVIDSGKRILIPSGPGHRSSAVDRRKLRTVGAVMPLCHGETEEKLLYDVDDEQRKTDV